MEKIILKNKKYMTQAFRVLIKAKGIAKCGSDDVQIIYVNYLCLKDYMERNLVHSIERIID